MARSTGGIPPAGTAPEPQYPIESVDRALRLLLMFRERPELRLVDAARELGVANSTVHRLMAMLIHHGFIAQDPSSRRYVPGDAVFDLGLAVLGRWEFITAVRPFVVRLAQSTAETTNVGVLRGRDVVFVLGAESQHTMRIADQVGTRVPAHDSATGKAILAQLPREELRRLYPQSSIALEPSGTLHRKQLEAELDEIAVAGYATRGGDDLGYFALAAAIVKEGHPVAAMSVAAPTHRVNADWRKTATAELLATVHQIEAKLPSHALLEGFGVLPRTAS